LQPTRDAFKARVAEVYPEKKPGAIPTYAGQMFRFVHEMKNGDIIVYPSKRHRLVHLGRVDGAYKFERGREPGYPHQRAVGWLRELPRTQFSQGALYEIGAAMGFFQVRNYAHEFLAALEGKAAAPPVAKDETVGAVAEEIEE